MDWTSNALLSTALALSQSCAHAKPGGRTLPPLLFLTDPDRTPKPWETVERLPAGAGVVFRGFGRPDATAVGRRLAETARRRGLIFLVGADAELGETLEVDGVHLPERAIERAVALRVEHPHWRITTAAHSAEALERAARAGADAALLSPVFPSRSPSAGAPLGAARVGELVRAARLPVYALGGVSETTAPALISSGACGVAAVEALLA